MRKRNKSRASEIDTFSGAFETMMFMEEYFRAKFEEESKMVSEKEKAAEEKAKNKARELPKFSFGQMLLGQMILSIFLAPFWFWLLH